jgi:signal transduction histidine kinase
MWEKIILNLLSNAFKFTLQGGITVRVHAEDGHAVLQVSDTGAGIRESDRAHVFERFYRAEGAGGRTHEGSGIGLALSHELVQLHGGRIEVTSRIGEGSTFRVLVPLGRAHLPAERIVERPGGSASRSFTRAAVEEAGRWLPGAGEEPEDPEGGEEAADPELRGASVLVVDDNADLRAYVVRLLRRHGAEVHAEPDGEAGLAAARGGAFDVVLADVMMPRLDCFAMARALKSDARTQMLPVILVSARAGESSRVEGLDLGADDYLVKPFSARELIARTAAQVRMRRMQQRFGRELERAVEDRTRELASINRQLVAFSYSVAHDLRAPVRAIHGMLDVLVDEMGTAVTPAAYGFMEKIRGATGRMDQLITDLLEYGRIGRVRLSLEPVKPAHAVADALVQLEHVLQARGAAVVDRVPMDLPPVTAHRLTLVQALVNLIDNATKFARPGHPPQVVLDAQRTPAGVRMRIQDNGVGIAPEHHARVFQVFVQIEDAARHQGTGIGLAIVKESIERMHGKVGIESTPGAGSTFWIELPLHQPAASPAATPAAAPAAG